jgi:hypothetical protein
MIRSYDNKEELIKDFNKGLVSPEPNPLGQSFILENTLHIPVFSKRFSNIVGSSGKVTGRYRKCIDFAPI